MRGIELKQSALYALPNGTELVVGVGRECHYFLYDPLVWKGYAWIINMPIEYEVNERGLIITGTGQPTSWHVQDLTDTHRMVERQL